MKVGIHISDLVVGLRGEGFEFVTARILRHAVLRGRIPANGLTASGDYYWTLSSVAAIRKYFKRPVRTGRPSKVSA